jgi:hypothetical protein
VDRVLVAPGGDEPDPGALFLDPVRSASIIPWEKSCGVEGTLVVSSVPARSTMAQSVKVPPMSMPTR